MTSRGEKSRLIVFDVEGVLIPKNRFIFEIGRNLGFILLLKMLLAGFLYEIGSVRLKTTLKRIYSFIKGMKVDTITRIFDNIPIMPNLNEVFDQLKTKGYKIALISSGLPDFIVDRLAKKLGADFAYGIQTGLNGEALTGEISGDVIESDGKLLALSKLLHAQKVDLKHSVAVADDRNNSSIFLKEIKKIGYNPDFILRIKADHIVTGRLSKILPIIDEEFKLKPRSLITDLVRETIHACGFFVPIIAALFGIGPMATLICAIIALYGFSEWSRMKGKNFPVVSMITRLAASQSELCTFAAAPIYFAIGILLTLLLFPIPNNYGAIAIFALGDSTASIFGSLRSGHPLPFNKGKTIEGSLTGFLFAFIAGLFFLSLPFALLGAAMAMTIECLPMPVNDNILIPLFTGFTLTIITI